MKIKKLEREVDDCFRPRSHNRRYISRVPYGFYSIWKHKRNKRFLVLSNEGMIEEEMQTIEIAKQKAQEHFESIIKGCLE